MIVTNIDDAIDEFATDIKKALHSKDIRNQYLEEQNKKLHDEFYKDHELQRMKNDLEEMKEDYLRGFPISKKEQNKIDEWIERHEKEAHNCYTFENKLRRGGCIGGTYTYHFIPTSIGTIGIVKCNCGAEFTFQNI